MNNHQMHQAHERAKKVGLNPPYTAIYQDMPNAISLIIGQQEWAEKGSFYLSIVV